MSATIATAELRAVFPDRAAWGGREVSVGPSGYRLLALVLAQGGAATLLAVGPEVYGRGDVRRGRVSTQISRLNAKLAEVGCPHRLSVDGDRVLLVL